MYERASGYNPRLGTDDFTGRTAAGIGTPLGSDSSRGGGGGDVNIGVPQTTINVHGGSDPRGTADHVIQGMSGVWDDVFRNAGTAVR